MRINEQFATPGYGLLDLTGWWQITEEFSVNAGVFNSGLLATDWPGQDAHYEYGAAPTDLIDRARRIASVCRRHADVTMARSGTPSAHCASPFLRLPCRRGGPADDDQTPEGARRVPA